MEIPVRNFSSLANYLTPILRLKSHFLIC
ncbi:protein of unknown function [Cupriavidus taiwanensis]|nr:protein of unknown function [Cupriavidus taiwanensis]SOZ11654.1 protein of unknown function [Cupriavidus taiwanensis]